MRLHSSLNSFDTIALYDVTKTNLCLTKIHLNVLITQKLYCTYSLTVAAATGSHQRHLHCTALCTARESATARATSYLIWPFDLELRTGLEQKLELMEKVIEQMKLFPTVTPMDG